MLGLLRSTIAETLELEHQTNLLPIHELTVIDNEATLANANTDAVRYAFREWVADDLPPRLCDEEVERFGGAAQIREKLLSNDAHHSPHATHPAACIPPQWQFFVFVDEECLRSLETSYGALDPMLKILTTDWNGSELDDTIDEYDDLEWMKIDASDYMPVYANLVTPCLWHEYYESPLLNRINRRIPLFSQNDLRVNVKALWRG
jgi:hypothetical protein